jgi:tetratricopeptide (TPR) repeat protein
MQAATWLPHNENSEWHRRVAIVLRNLGRREEAVKHFEQALECDATNFAARCGLGKVYDRPCASQHPDNTRWLTLLYLWLSGNNKSERQAFKKAVSLGDINISAMERELQQPLTENRRRKLCAELCLSYNNQADRYRTDGNVPLALTYSRKSVAIGVKPRYAAILCFTILLNTKNPERFAEVVAALRILEQHKSFDNNYSCLTDYILQSRETFSSMVFDESSNVVANSAKQTGNLQGLIDAYVTALHRAKLLTHMNILQIKTLLVSPYQDYDNDHFNAEPLIEEIAQSILRQSGQLFLKTMGAWDEYTVNGYANVKRRVQNNAVKLLPVNAPSRFRGV